MSRFFLARKSRPAANQRRYCRSAATTVEFAVIAPLLFMVLLGSLEFARVNQVMNATSFSAYQGCRQAIVPGATASAATTEVNRVLSANLISSGTVTVNPSTITNSTETVTVTVAINLDSVCWIIPRFTTGKTITRTCTLTREKTS